jgi:hypothetical protein
VWDVDDGGNPGDGSRSEFYTALMVRPHALARQLRFSAKSNIHLAFTHV